MIQQYIDYARAIENKSENTLRAYEQDLRAFARFIQASRKGARWSTIDQGDITRYVTERRNAGISAKTTNRAISSIKQFYDFLKSQHDANLSNPARYMVRGKIGKKQPNTIPFDDLRAAINKTTGALQLMLMILTDTGIRLQEMLDLEIKDIDTQARTLRVNGKGNKQRTCYFSLRTAAAIEKHAPFKGGRLFRGIDQRTARHMIWEILVKASNARQLSPHAIRHTYATTCARNGMPAVQLQKLLGHEQINTTQQYINFAAIDTQSAAQTYAPHL